jgi:hypothetical protein
MPVSDSTLAFTQRGHCRLHLMRRLGSFLVDRVDGCVKKQPFQTHAFLTNHLTKQSSWYLCTLHSPPLGATLRSNAMPLNTWYVVALGCHTGPYRYQLVNIKDA